MSLKSWKKKLKLKKIKAVIVKAHLKMMKARQMIWNKNWKKYRKLARRNRLKSIIFSVY